VNSRSARCAASVSALLQSICSYAALLAEDCCLLVVLPVVCESVRKPLLQIVLLVLVFIPLLLVLPACLVSKLLCPLMLKPVQMLLLLNSIMSVGRVTCGESLTDQSVSPVAKVLVAPKLMLHVGCSQLPCAPLSVPAQCQSCAAAGVSTSDDCLSFVSTVAPANVPVWHVR
jgi:hypothetical protein